MRIPKELDIHRIPHPLIDGDAAMGDLENGCFKIPLSAAPLIVIVATGAGWEHISVSTPDRCPTWDEMQFIKRRFWPEDVVVMQLHVAERDHINMHPHCLHLWRPLYFDIPLPPAWMVA
jgi:hypothetical protein